MAYVVGKNGLRVDVPRLRNHLKKMLPEYRPTAYVELKRMPLTPNGKLDHRALPQPETRGREVEENYRSPQTAIEEIVAGIWSEILRLERVGMGQNFFDLGGHSLLATRAVSRIEKCSR